MTESRRISLPRHKPTKEYLDLVSELTALDDRLKAVCPTEEEYVRRRHDVELLSLSTTLSLPQAFEKVIREVTKNEESL